MYRLFERAVAVLVLLFSMQAFYGLIYPDIREISSRGTAPKPGVMTLQAVIYLLLFIVMKPRLAHIISALGKMRLLCSLFLLAAASSIWSVDPMLTFRRIIPLFVWLMVGVYFGTRYSVDEFLQLLSWTFAIVITSTVVLYFLNTAYVLDPGHDVAWRGVCVHKNIFGPYMVLSALVFAIAARQRFPLFNGLFCAASVLLVFLSHSATALVLGLAVLLSLPLWRLVKLPTVQLVPIASVILCVFVQVVVILVRSPEDLLNLLQRDSTLTGRQNLWEAVLIAIGRRPLLGYGYDAFWQGLKGESLQAAINAGWMAPHAHNGYLELGLGLGFVGLALFALIAASMVLSALRYLRGNPGAAGVWPIAFATFLVVHNLVESALLMRNELPSLLFVTVFASLKAEEYRHSRAFSRQSGVRTVGLRPGLDPMS